MLNVILCFSFSMNYQQQFTLFIFISNKYRLIFCYEYFILLHDCNFLRLIITMVIRNKNKNKHSIPHYRKLKKSNNKIVN